MTSGPGTYVLLIEAPERGEARIGKLGTIAFDGGWLLYVGSAFGSGGLRARVRRHLGNSKTLHWHIDYLLAEAEVTEVWWTDDDTKREESWVEALRGMPEARVPLRRFGSGDCGCEGHLVHVPERPGMEALRGRTDEPAGSTGMIRRSAPDEIDFA